MRNSGCTTIKVGIETGSEKILHEINKGISLDQVRKAARLLNKRGFFWSAYFMYGLPTETEIDMLKTLEFVKEVNPPYAGLGLYAPMPNTPLWDQGLALGLIDPSINIDHFFKVNPKDYFFKNYKKRMLNMDYETFKGVSSKMVTVFNNHNKSLINLLRRAWSRKNLYFTDLKLLFHDIKKAKSWILN
jgi:radical SAM superfamily enzyme YgiQ (UPF0313 family)